MAIFVKANRKRVLDENKMLANVGYSAGVLGSMSLAKRMPKFEEVFKFPETEEDVEMKLERSKAQMMAYAINANRLAQEEKQNG